jgi:hypothetical protein
LKQVSKFYACPCAYIDLQACALTVLRRAHSGRSGAGSRTFGYMDAAATTELRTICTWARSPTQLMGRGKRVATSSRERSREQPALGIVHMTNASEPWDCTTMGLEGYMLYDNGKHVCSDAGSLALAAA